MKELKDLKSPKKICAELDYRTLIEATFLINKRRCSGSVLIRQLVTEEFERQKEKKGEELPLFKK